MKRSLVLFLVCAAFGGAQAQRSCSWTKPGVKYPSPIKPGHPLVHPVPVYPERAKAHGIEGRLTFCAHILEDGTVAHVTVLSGPPELQESAQKTLYAWKYTPWTANGQPIEAYTVIPVGFGIGQGNTVSTVAKFTGQKISPVQLQALLVRSYPARLPKEAKKAGISGTVQLHITLDEAGRIVDLGVLSGPEELEDAALETVRHWQYQPYLSAGQFIAVESTVDVSF